MKQKENKELFGNAKAFTELKEISVLDIGPLRIGQVENREAATGMTVLISEEGMRAGLDVRGGGPASRDSQILNPLMAAQQIHSVVLSGGSAFGLGAANGVMKFLEEKDIGFDTGVAKVPLVVQSDIFDLSVGQANVRPDAEMGYAAAKAAFESPNYRDGNYGAGCGASVGKAGGMETAMKTGVGSYAVQIGDLKLGAIVVLNALGDIYDWKNGRQIAGLLSEDKSELASTMQTMCRSIEVIDNKFTGNTTIAVIITNAHFEKAQLCKIAGMGHDGYARSINPVHTSADGDSIYAVSVGEVAADQDLVGALGAQVLSEAIVRAVTSADKGIGIYRPRDMESVDALITNEPNVTLVTYYADCTPLFFVDTEKRAIGLAHAGWRSTVGRIGEKVIKKMTALYGTDPKNIKAAVGPAISVCCYEVDEPCAANFLSMTDLSVERFVFSKGGGKYMLDLLEANRQILMSAGVPEESITLSDLCTNCNSTLLWSHRATKGHRGTMSAMMCLK